MSLAVVLFPGAILAAPLPVIPLQASGYETLPKNEQIVGYLNTLAATYERASVVLLGKSAGRRNIAALLISADNSLQNPETAPGKRLRMMLVAGQHGNESAGPEALQLLARSLLGGELKDIPQKVDLILVPNANPDGRDLDLQRENANGVNTNTDYILLTQPEGQALSRALTRYRPHTVLDIHESAAYKEESLAQQGYITEFDIQYEIGFEPNIDQRIRSFGVDTFLPALLARAKKEGVTARRYIREIVDINEPITHGGITLRNFRNYSGFHDSFSTLVEGRLDPPGGDYSSPGNIRERSEELYQSVAVYVRQIVAMREQIGEVVRAARRGWQGPVGNGALALESEYALDPEQPKLKVPLQKIETGEIEYKAFDYHGKVVTLENFQPPPAYLVSDYQDRIASLLGRQGIQYRRLEKPAILEGVVRTISNLEVTPPPRDKGRYTVELQLEQTQGQVKAEAGDLWIDLSQPDGRLVPLLLEPKSSTSIYQEPDYTDMLKNGPFYIYSVNTLANDKHR